MKKTLITITLTTVVVLTMVGIVSSPFSRGEVQFNPIYSSLDNTGSGGGGAPDYYMEEMPAAPAEYAASDAVKSAELAGNTFIADPNRLVIKNADLAIVVPDPKADMTRISRLAEELGGYVVASNLYQSYYGPNSIEVPEATVTIRVPSDQLDEALERIKETAVEVDYENVSGVDVTSEYVDLQSRLAAKEAAEKKLLEIMDSAEDAEDVRAIFADVQTVQTEIEVLKGQIKYYEESAALSAISVRLIAEEGTQPIAIGPWRPEGAAKQAVENLVRFFQNFVDFLIQFVIFLLPSLILIAIPVYGVFVAGRAIFRRFAKSKVKVEEQAEEQK